MFTNHGVLFGTWGIEGTSKPFERFWENLQDGELELYQVDEQIMYQTHRAQTIILAEVGGKLSMLFEEKTFRNGLVVPSSREYSTREKRKFVLGETAQQACLRGLAEELQQYSVASSDITLLHEETGREHPSRSYPGLLSQTTKTVFLWRMPKERVRKKYIESCGYCTNRFTWGVVPEKILRVCKPHLKRAA